MRGLNEVAAGDELSCTFDVEDGLVNGSEKSGTV